MTEPQFTDDPNEIAQRLTNLLDAVVDRLIADGMHRSTCEAQAPLHNPVYQVYFRAGLLACREYMARFVETESPSIAASIRANWWPDLGVDPGQPRRLNWDEVAELKGDADGHWTAKKLDASTEALPVAFTFINISASMEAMTTRRLNDDL